MFFKVKPKNTKFQIVLHFFLSPHSSQECPFREKPLHVTCWRCREQERIAVVVHIILVEVNHNGRHRGITLSPVRNVELHIVVYAGQERIANRLFNYAVRVVSKVE